MELRNSSIPKLSLHGWGDTDIQGEMACPGVTRWVPLTLETSLCCSQSSVLTTGFDSAHSVPNIPCKSSPPSSIGDSCLFLFSLYFFVLLNNLLFCFHYSVTNIFKGKILKEGPLNLALHIKKADMQL